MIEVVVRASVAIDTNKDCTVWFAVDAYFLRDTYTGSLIFPPDTKEVESEESLKVAIAHKIVQDLSIQGHDVKAYNVLVVLT